MLHFFVGMDSITELYMFYKGSDGNQDSSNLGIVCNKPESAGNFGKKSSTFMSVQKIRGVKNPDCQ